MNKFKWGVNFYKVNEELLDVYAACKTGADVVEAQQKHLQMLQLEGAAARMIGMY